MDCGKMTKDELVSEVERLNNKLKTFESRQSEENLNSQAHVASLGSDIGKALIIHNSLRMMLHKCTKALVKHLDASFARILTLNNAGNMLELQASAGKYTHIDGPHSQVPVGKYKIGMIAKECKPHLTNDVINDPRISNREWAEREGMVVFADYPLIAEDLLVGVMAMFSQQPLTDDTIDALASVTDQITLGIVRKRGEEKMRRLSRVVEQSPAIVVMTDTKGDIEYVNPEFTRVTGYRFEEALGQNPRILKTSKTPQKEFELLWKSITAGLEWRGTFHNIPITKWF